MEITLSFVFFASWSGFSLPASGYFENVDRFLKRSRRGKENSIYVHSNSLY